MPRKTTKPRTPAHAPDDHDPLRHELDGHVYTLDAPPRRGARGRNVVTVRQVGDSTSAGRIRLPGAFRKRITGSRSWMLGSLTRRPTRPLGWPVSASDTAERGFGIADVSGRAWPATPRTNRSSA